MRRLVCGRWHCWRWPDCWLWPCGAPRGRRRPRGYVFGLAWFGGGLYWIFISCYRYGNMDAASATLVTAALVAYLALFPALALYAARRLGAGDSAFLLAAPGTLGLAEWLRSWLLTGFPWLAPGYSQIDSPLGAFAPLARGGRCRTGPDSRGGLAGPSVPAPRAALAGCSDVRCADDRRAGAGPAGLDAAGRAAGAASLWCRATSSSR